VAGQGLQLSATPGNGPLILGIRAENLELAGEGTGLSADVVVAEPLGSHNLLTCTLGGGYVKVSTRPEQKPEPGTRIWLRPVPDKVRWFDPETGWAR
jgi:multiple sugar transport system ATP-binding protein